MFEGLSPSHLIIVAVIALLLFGDRLPEVMRSIGKGVMEFKKGMRGIESAIESAANSPSSTTSQAQVEATARRDEISAPRFDPPTSEPRVESKETISYAAPAPHPVTEQGAEEHHGEHV
jgi:sec-independent protein translocase protein TatA